MASNHPDILSMTAFKPIRVFPSVDAGRVHHHTQAESVGGHSLCTEFSEEFFHICTVFL